MRQSLAKPFSFHTSLLLLAVVMAIPHPVCAVRNLKIGDSMPGFFLPRADGIVGMYDSAQLAGQPAVIAFCRPDHNLSLDALRDLDAVARQVGLAKFRLLAVDTKLSTAQEIQATFADEKFSFPILLDPQRTLYEEVGLIVSPTTLLFDAKGGLRFVIASHPRQFRHVVEARLRFLLGEIDEQTMNKQIHPAVRKIEADMTAAWHMYNLGKKLQSEGKTEQAISTFEKAVSRYPSLVEARCALGFLKFSAGDMDSAAKHFEAALRQNPTFPSAQLGSAIVLARTGEDRKAEQMLLPLVGQRSLDARARYELGRIYIARGERDKALKFFQDALASIFPEPASVQTGAVSQ
ncbi:MAG: tetratricopeptide repeat protein [Planctomycetota bacterium]